MKRSLLILGSGSPRRLELLSPYFDLRVITADIDERAKRDEPPLEYVKRVTKEKWLAVQSKWLSQSGLNGEGRSKRHLCLLTADTCVFLGGEILGKPSSASQAKQFLQKLSHREHRVATSFAIGCIASKTPQKIATVQTIVRFRDLTTTEIKQYVTSQEWKGKAGGYAIQGSAIQFVAEIHGSLTNVIGLPVEEVLSQWRDLSS